MSFILNKENVQTSDVLCQKYSQTMVECDVIVPDIKPDISKILEVSGYITVSEKGIRAGKVYLQGCVNMTVLYAPDGDVISKVASLTASREFTHTIDTGGADNTANLTVEVEPESFNYSLINSRKVSLRCMAGISIKLSRITEIEIPVSITGDGICINTTPLRLCNTAVNSENRLVLCEQLELPSGKPTIGELLKTTVFPQSLEFSFSEGQATVHGEVKICNLFTSADDGSVQFTEHTVPFNETLDVDGAEEDMEGEIEYSVSDMYCEVRDDSDGEPRIIGIELGLCAAIRGLSIREFDMICDAYFPNGETELSYEQKTVEQLIDTSTAQLTHKTSLNIPEILPSIKQVCDISSTASVERIAVDNGEITVFGKILCNVLYTADDDMMPLAAFSNTSEFSHSFAVPDCQDNTICDAKIFTEHISYTLNGGGGIDLRVVLGLSLRSYKTEVINPISDISVSEEDENHCKPYITIYFVKSGDTLWNIAKRYKTTVKALKDCNNLNSDNLQIGQQIKICR